MGRRKPSAITSARWSLPSLRLVIVCLSLAVCFTIAAVILYVDVEVTPLSEMFLTQKYFPPGQGLRPKLRRRTRLNPVSCENYGMEKDFQFVQLDGQQCAQAAWESTAETEKENRYVSKIDTVYKSFLNATAAKLYYSACWGNNSYELLPVGLYSMETANAPKAGDENKAFSWDLLIAKSDPNQTQLSLLTDDVMATPRHVIYIFRQDKIVVRILVQGFHNSKDQRLNVGLAGRLGGHISELITKFQPSPLRNQLITVQESLRSLLRHGLPDTMTKVWSDCITFVTDGILHTITSQLSRIFIRTTAGNDPSYLKSPEPEPQCSRIYYFFAAIVILLVYQVQAFLEPYNQMNMLHHKYVTLSVSASVRNRRQLNSGHITRQ